MILFSELFSQAGLMPDRIDGDAQVSTLVMDSRKAVPGCCFVCMPSESSDSHSFLAAAQDGGALAAIVHSEDGFEIARGLGLAAALVNPGLGLDGTSAGAQASLPAPCTAGNLPAEIPASEPTPTAIPDETPEQRIRRTTGRFSDAMWRLAKVAFDDPSSKLKVIGVTGTNGKTTTAWLIRDMLNLMGTKCAYIGTLGFGLPGESGEELRELANTTPFTVELNAMLAEAVERGCQAVAMEVSSHALAEKRADGVNFAVLVFTNMSQDHLDYHGNMEAYERAKERLFAEFFIAPQLGGIQDYRGGVGWTWAAINFSDTFGRHLIEDMQLKGVRTFGSGPGQDEVEEGAVQLESSNVGLSRIDLNVRFVDRVGHGWAPLGGDYNVWNLLGAITAIEALGENTGDRSFTFENALAVAPRVRPVPGRFEPVLNDSGIGVIVDYAHTPDALEKLLATARPLTSGRLLTVFGCGGDRDKGKRPLMAKAAHAGSDVVIVTSDNPRTEDPDAILQDILKGIEDPREDARIPVYVEPDRPVAVALACKLARPGDTVVIAGKGHENYQIIGRTKHPMDDRDLARSGLAARQPE